jgi:hypothetical protein
LFRIVEEELESRYTGIGRPEIAVSSTNIVFTLISKSFRFSENIWIGDSGASLIMRKVFMISVGRRFIDDRYQPILDNV